MLKRYMERRRPFAQLGRCAGGLHLKKPSRRPSDPAGETFSFDDCKTEGRCPVISYCDLHRGQQNRVVCAKIQHVENLALSQSRRQGTRGIVVQVEDVADKFLRMRIQFEQSHKEVAQLG